MRRPSSASEVVGGRWPRRVRARAPGYGCIVHAIRQIGRQNKHPAPFAPPRGASCGCPRRRRDRRRASAARPPAPARLAAEPRQRPRDDDLLLVAAGERARVRSRSVGAPERVMRARASASSASSRGARVPQRTRARRGPCCRAAWRRGRAFELAVLADERGAAPFTSPRSGRCLARARRRARAVRSPRRRHAHDLAGVHRERHVVERAPSETPESSRTTSERRPHPCSRPARGRRSRLCRAGARPAP